MQLAEKLNITDRAVSKWETGKAMPDSSIMLELEIVMGIIAVLPLIAAVIIASIVPMEEWKGSLLVGVSLLPLLIATPFALIIEQKAGYYECRKCGKMSWQKKVLHKEQTSST